MQKKWNIFTISSILAILIFILEFILYKEITFIYTTNIFFYPASFFLIIGLFSLVIRSGSFDFFYYSFKKATRRLRKNTLEKDSDITVSYLSDTFGTHYPFFVKVGSILMTISLMALIGHYLF
ncbi:DUF3899 domain-containing protein [Marinilactibacillus psychrotolerans]|uniref:DUF3899 domain-containing protein n=1 Tax=Marinilactibacillus psychrotolerans TaxID=191770 RepID=A0AAV3WU67_9LACT|nr:DUF3899 domain-containing protein [Marinilactibacillus psychrotolerans]GEL66620.1 hypothetical protein MPS01_07750 [Marinilactibacillus psychrotolerans]GEQ35142.1 hypothetical protein M132T_06500 [Marinilactibacillus psychrotolerans]SDC83228.1 protein of unknown function [Marinilactibacillus psychrotolerans]